MSAETNKQSCYNNCVHRLLPADSFYIPNRFCVPKMQVIKAAAFQEVNNTPDNDWLLRAPDWLFPRAMKWSECSLQCCLQREKTAIVIVAGVMFWCTQCYNPFQMIFKTLNCKRAHVTHSHTFTKKTSMARNTVYRSTFVNIPAVSFMLTFPGRERERLQRKGFNVNAAKNWNWAAFCGSRYTFITKDHAER